MSTIQGRVGGRRDMGKLDITNDRERGTTAIMVKGPHGGLHTFVVVRTSDLRKALRHDV